MVLEGSCLGFSFNVAGSVRVNILPLFNSLLTLMCPSISVASFFEIVSPIPYPPYCLSMVELAWVNSTNIVDKAFSGIPTPVSDIAILILESFWYA